MAKKTHRLLEIDGYDSLVQFLADELDWPIDLDSFDDASDLAFDYDPKELGLSEEFAAKVRDIKQMRPLADKQPWAVFYLDFEPKRLPVTVLRRVLTAFVEKKRARADRPTWKMQDLLFINAHGEGDTRGMTFANFSQPEQGYTAVMREFMWNRSETQFAHLERYVSCLQWPDEGISQHDWREQWRSAFVGSKRKAIRDSRELAEEMAHFAHEVRRRTEEVLELTRHSAKHPLQRLFSAFKTALIHDLTESDFADAYAQTMAYGLFTARASRPTETFRLKDAVAMIPGTNPFLRDLFAQCFGLTRSGGGRLDIEELGLARLVELFEGLTPEDMQRILDEFGSSTGDPVIHFYESFLGSYDKKRKVERGVFYTPQPVVSYIVRSVHELLQTEFGLADGLADTTTWGEMVKKHPDMTLPQGTSPSAPFVQILDPATGTGTFLVEVIDVIHKTLCAKWCGEDKRRWNDYVAKHLLPRLHGYELMMAPYAIGHMKIGLKLADTGYRFQSNERARVYLTNSLEPPTDDGEQREFEQWAPAIAHEAAAVNAVKRNERFTVVIGNPPYSIQSQNLNDTARAWVDAYRKVAGAHIVERNALQFEKNIQDDYIKFIRFSEVAVNTAGNGIVGLVTSHGFLDGATFRGMRWSLLQSFSKLWVLDLHGNANKREVAPDGTKDENVFDISQGVAVSLFVKPTMFGAARSVNLADLWGSRLDAASGKYRWLSGHSRMVTLWKETAPTEPLFLFRKTGGGAQHEYEAYPSLADVMPLYSMGIKSSRDELVVDFEPAPILARIERFRSAQVSDDAICEQLGVPMKTGWNVAKARKDLRALKQLPPQIQTFLYRPLDWRLLFYHRAVVFSAAYPVMHHLLAGRNLAFVATRQTKDQWDVQSSRSLVGHKSLGAYDANSVFPLYLVDDASESQQTLVKERRINVAAAFLKTLSGVLGIPQKGKHGLPAGLTPEDIFHYAYGVFHSPGYRRRYAEFLKMDFPRLPLTGNLELFRALARLGGDLVALHLMESPELSKHITQWVGGKTAEVEKVSYANRTVWIDKVQTEGFRGVPEPVWNFHIGGYQVCEKWLKDRKGRKLSADDIDHYQKIVVALAETIRIMGEIDVVIEKHGGWPGAFATGTKPPSEAPELALG